MTNAGAEYDGAPTDHRAMSHLCAPRPLALLGALGALAVPATAHADARTWVSGVGDDVNPCTRFAPCKTFAGAIAKTDAGGVIGVLDPGGFGGVTITKSITIDASGGFAGVLVAGTNGIVVNNAAADVVLRGLTIEHKAPCAAPGTANGVRVVAARTVRIEDSVIQGFPGAGVADQAGGATVTVAHSELLDNCTAGVSATTAAGTTALTLTGSLVANAPVGVLADARSTLRIADDQVAGNVTGVAARNGGTLVSAGDNRVAGNGTDGVPTEVVTPWAAPAPAATPAPSEEPAATPAATTTAATPASPTPAATARCRVPKLRHTTLARAQRRLELAGCRLGTVRVRRPRARAIAHPRVVAQSPRAGWTAARGAAVTVTLIRKRKPVPARANAAVVPGATRTWVSGVGDDVNPCSRTAPCATFAGAYAKTTDGGTIDVLDPGDFGPLTIDRPITIDGAGRPAGIQVAAGQNAIVVAAGPSDVVTLRGLDLAGPGCAAAGAGDGVRVDSAGVVHLSDVTARGFAGSGVAVAPAAGATVTVSGGALTGSCTQGLLASGAVGALVDHAFVSGNATGLMAAAGATVRLGAAAVTGNETGFAGAGAIAAWDGGAFAGNGALGVTPGRLNLL